MKFNAIKSKFLMLVAIVTVFPVTSSFALTLNSSQKQTLQDLEGKINKISSISANFVQTSSSGGYAEGRMIMKRPGKMRLQYDKPKSAALITNSSVTVWHEDGKNKNIPTSKTPLSLLTAKNFSFSDNRINIVGFKDLGDDVIVTFVWKPRPQDGTMSIRFSKYDANVIRGWDMSDGTGYVISVSLSKVKRNPSAPGNIFHVNNVSKW